MVQAEAGETPALQGRGRWHWAGRHECPPSRHKRQTGMSAPPQAEEQEIELKRRECEQYAMLDISLDETRE